MTVQKLKPIIYSEFEAARRYYALISVLNNLELKNMELNLLAYIAEKGSISNTNNKQTFCQDHKSTIHSINNCVRGLKKKGLLIKSEGKIKTIPSIALNFKEPVIIKVTLDAETREEEY